MTQMKQLPFTKDQVGAWGQQTPYYVYDKAGITACVKEIYKAFSWNRGFKEYFAVKACPNPSILRLLASLGCGADCASVAELLLAEKSGITGQNIIFSSNETSEEEYKKAFATGSIINLDDESHIDFLEGCLGGRLPDTICCRYNPGKFGIANDIMGHLYDSKFGMTHEQLLNSYRILAGKGVKNFGLHAMLASCSLENDYYPTLARNLFSLVLEIKEKTGVQISFIDMSGGIGIPYTPEERAVDMMQIGSEVKRVYDEILGSRGIEVAIFTEMGRYITGPYGYLVTRVLHHKHIYKDYVGVDATACNLMRPAIYGAYHHITVLGKENAMPNTVVDVVGSLCENNDKFAIDRALPETKRGDILVIHDAGAHGYSMGYNYNGKLKCAEYMLEDGKLTMIRRAETEKDYFATLDIDPAFR